MPDSQNLTPSEFKKLVCDIAVAIAPELIKKLEKKDGDHERGIAYLSYDFADAERVVLKDRANSKI